MKFHIGYEIQKKRCADRETRKGRVLRERASAGGRESRKLGGQVRRKRRRRDPSFHLRTPKVARAVSYLFPPAQASGRQRGRETPQAGKGLALSGV